MKKIFWTTFFWLIVVLGFLFYVRTYNVNIANNFSSWLGATAVVSQDTLDEWEEADLMTEIAAIKDTIADIQTRLGGSVTPEITIEEEVPTVEAE